MSEDINKIQTTIVCAYVSEHAHIEAHLITDKYAISFLPAVEAMLW